MVYDEIVFREECYCFPSLEITTRRLKYSKSSLAIFSGLGKPYIHCGIPLKKKRNGLKLLTMVGKGDLSKGPSLF